FDNCKVTWLADSGASEHMSNDKSIFDVLVPLAEPMEIAVALNGKTAIAKFSGSVKMIAVVGNMKHECTLKNVLYAPELRCNLFSIRKVDMAGMKVIFKNDYEGRIQMHYIPTEQQLADIMTKGLPGGTFVRLREALGLQRLSRGVE
uniref:Retrovirus-related Pol polyprotein from transposon TNT 1-94-like beta-barrel domain-containing protein n=1 Tax=Anopheles atroparvus TaxID=41427 RepID=A0AAG5DTW8_ANOAO